MKKKTPRALGYFMPPEWFPHKATWLSWPRPEGISFPDKYHQVLPTLMQIVRAIAAHEEVHINVPNGNWEYIVREQLRRARCPLRKVFFHHIMTNECWCRDHGPTFLVRKKRSGYFEGAIVNWKYNAWGGKYLPYNADAAVPKHLAEELDLPIFSANLVCEGGAIDVNGAGTLLTTENCLLNNNRNPGLKKRQVEIILKEFYGQKHILWLDGGLVGDDTDGHIDSLARFINPRTIVMGVEDDPKDENYKPLQENLKRLRRMKDQDGKLMRIIKMPMPDVVEYKSQRLPATYMNFYFVNGAVLVPTFRQPKRDKRALQILREHLPKHKVIGIDCVDLVWGLGAIHCLTQQQPRFD